MNENKLRFSVFDDGPFTEEKLSRMIEFSGPTGHWQFRRTLTGLEVEFLRLVEAKTMMLEVKNDEFLEQAIVGYYKALAEKKA